MNQPFRIAFVGVDNPHGAHWRQLLLNFAGEIEITALMPGYGGSTANLEERYARLPRFETVDQLLADGQFEGAVVALPNDVGPAVVAKLAAAGKHVMAEKPVAGSPDDVQQIVDAVRGSGVAFQNGYMWRYDEAANRLRDMVRDGRFGKLISLEMTFVTSDVERRGPNHYLFDAAISRGGFFNWLACHYLDLMLYVLDEPVTAVTSRVGQMGAVDVEVEDGGIAIMELAGGGLATFNGGYWLPRWAGESHWCLRGSQRWVHWDPGKPGTGGSLEIHGPQPQWHAMEETFDLPEDNTPGYGGSRGVALVRDWLEAAREGGRACRNTPETTQATLQLIETIYQASREGRRVECRIGG